MSNLLKAMHALEHLSKKADVVGQMRISITFDSERDKAYFTEEVKREMKEQNLVFLHPPYEWGEATIYGIKVRIL